MKENKYVLISDIYFTKVDEDKYLITDRELSKLIVKYRTLEREFEYARNRQKKYYKRMEERIKHYHTLAHTYKVELGRCRRKLTRIYKLFDEYILTVCMHFPLGSAEFNFYIKCVEDMRKEFKNV